MVQNAHPINQSINQNAALSHEILQQRAIERRSAGRTHINRNALMFFPGQAGVHSCYALDVTNR
jgi:hypothetical protein